MSFASVKSNISRKASNNSKNVIEKSTSITENLQFLWDDLKLGTKTPSQLDISINNCRVSAILDEAINKIQIAVNLRILLHHKACRLRQCLKRKQVEYIQTACFKHLEKFSSPLELRHKAFTQKTSNIIDRISKTSRVNQIDSHNVNFVQYDIAHLLDPHIIKAMEMMCNNDALMNKTLSEWCLTREPLSISLVNSMVSLRDIMKYRLSMSAVEEKTREKSLRNAYRSNATLLQKIERTKEELENQRNMFKIELDKKQAVIDFYLDNIKKTTETYNNKIRMRVLTSGSQMCTNSAKSYELQIQLEEDANTAIATYENLLAKNLKTEKELRKSRLKVETQLSSWITKYDTDVGERQAVFDELSEGYEAEKKEYEALMRKFNEQNLEYEPLMEEKRAEEQRIFEEKCYIFLCTRAARRIQRYWRAYRARKIARRKAKRDKKGKKGKKAGDKIKLPKRPKDKKDKKKKKGKKEPPGLAENFRGPDFNEKLDNKFGDDVFEELQGPEFEQKHIEVDLADPET